jgi:acyl-coenzyme A synthetase/AMP-(fatty) acid ligase/acyl carrier protein
MLSHAGLCNLSAAQRQAFGIDGDTRVLQFSPLSFDASVWETFMALANGATLCLARQEVLASGVELARLIQEKRVSNVTLPPSVVRVLPREDLPELRTVIAAGEACTAELAAGWGKGREFYNAYGPTETTVCASMKRCRGDDGPPPIGRPIANTRLYILDGNLRPVPVGVPGELCVGGVSLARGYLGRPELTAEKFIPDPFEQPRDQSQGGRLYRTGDLVKYLPGGDIQFLGRIDQQVKVRGFRIELGEVDEVLHQVKGVKQGVVVAHGDRLVAYVVPEGTEDPPGNEIRKAMRERLPEYMVPSRFVYLDHLPMTPSGKVDRKALPVPDSTRPETGREYAPPTNTTEEKLAAMYQDLLGIERVGIHDNFFELGGHSLLATQLASRIREEFAVEIPLRTIFEHPSVAELAVSLDSIETKKPLSPIAPMRRESHRMKRSDLAQPAHGA